jgi:hypothetical protein
MQTHRLIPLDQVTEPYYTKIEAARISAEATADPVEKHKYKIQISAITSDMWKLLRDIKYASTRV